MYTNKNNNGNMSSLRQVRRGDMRLNVAVDDCCKYNTYNKNKNNSNINMNDSKGVCSCHKQSHCNRLTSYCSNYSNSSSRSNISSQCKTLPLFIIVTVLMLATPLIDAAVLKRSVAETSTTLNITAITNNTQSDVFEEIIFTTTNIPLTTDMQVTTINITTNDNTPLATIEEIDYTTENTPFLAKTPTTVSLSENTKTNKNNTDADVVIVNETKINTVKTNNNQTLTLNMTQDVNNEIIHHGVAEVIVNSDFIKPKYDYTDTLLDGNLEETIRNSVKNEIEFEHDIGAAVIEQLQEITDPEERQKLTDEILTIQNAQQRSNTKVGASEAVDVLTKLTSNEPTAVPHQQSPTTKSAEVQHSSNKDLSIYFPAKSEDHPTTEQYIVNNQRNARNLNEISNENSEILNESNKVNHIAENDGMQNIEEEKEDSLNELLDDGKNSTATPSNQLPVSELYSHEANEITEEGAISIQEEIDKLGKNNDRGDDSKVNHENIDVKFEEKEEEKEFANSNNTTYIDVNESAVTQVQDNELTIVFDENINTTQENIESEPKPDAPEDMPNELNEAVIKPAEGDEASLSIVLKENLTATEPVVALANEQLEELLNLNEVKDTTIETETEKNIHIVIKKQGVELNEDIIEDDTTTDLDLEQETPMEEGRYEEKEIAETTATTIQDGESDDDAQNDDAANEETTTETDEARAVQNVTQISTDSNDEPMDGTNQISINNNEQSRQGEHLIFDTTDPTSNELDAKFETVEQDLPKQNQDYIHTNSEDDNHTENSKTTQEIISVSTDEPKENTIFQEEVEDSNNNKFTSTEESVRIRISHTSTFQTPAIDATQQTSTNSSTSAIETQTTTLKEFEVYEDNTDDPNIVPILVGVSGGQGDVTASTKGSRSINTQTHHSMLLTQMDDTMAATLFETFPPQNAGQMFNNHLAAESSGGRIGKTLPALGVSEASTSVTLFSGSGLIIVLCASIAFMFLLASIVAFVISFQRQRGTLDIEMQEQHCGKDNLDEEDENDEVGACTKLLEIELPKSTIANSSEELEECL